MFIALKAKTPMPTNAANAVNTKGRRDRQNTIRLRSIASPRPMPDH
jgi:hypothetical protein